MEKLRPCMVKTGSKTGRAEEPAIFHRFADRPTIREEQMYVTTVAIIEMNDGTVKEVPPTDLRFTDRIS